MISHADSRLSFQLTKRYQAVHAGRIVFLAAILATLR
jgi:hypothetical protein